MLNEFYTLCLGVKQEPPYMVSAKQEFAEVWKQSLGVSSRLIQYDDADGCRSISFDQDLKRCCMIPAASNSKLYDSSVFETKNLQGDFRKKTK